MSDTSSYGFETSSDTDFYNYKLNIVLTDFSKSMEDKCGKRTRFMIDKQIEDFLDRFDILVYANGCNLENQGYISIQFLENKEGHLNSETITFTFSCIVSIIDNVEESRFPQSFAVIRCAGIDETHKADPYTPFGLERFVDCKTIMNCEEELISDNRLIILLDISLSEYFTLDTVYARNIFISLSCDYDIEPMEMPDGTIKYKLPFGTELFDYLKTESPYFKCIEETPMVEAASKFFFICANEYPAFCKLGKFLSAGTLRHIESVEEFAQLYDISDKYELLRVKELCAEHLKNLLTYENASDILILADMHSDEILKTTVIRYIRSFWSDVVLTDGWQSLVNVRMDLAEEVLEGVTEMEKSSVGNRIHTEEISENRTILEESEELGILNYFS